MSYYWLNRQELLKKANEKCDNGGKEKAAVIKEKAKNAYRNFSEEEKEVQRFSSKDRYYKLKEKSN